MLKKILEQLHNWQFSQEELICTELLCGTISLVFTAINMDSAVV
jgi:hypothetical protein